MNYSVIGSLCVCQGANLKEEGGGGDSVMNLGLYVNLLGPPAWPLIQWYYAWGPCKLSNVQAMYI